MAETWVSWWCGSLLSGGEDLWRGEASIKDGHGGVFKLMVDYGDGFDGWDRKEAEHGMGDGGFAVMADDDEFVVSDCRSIT
ncbi:hypothetical protein M0R45_030115 [Rubus argutus]|uniref:Uncharacterized protein n=1 Tax=Rubus argutus TaxID=59490 RepID=A0AAW1WCL5_RUBAR